MKDPRRGIAQNHTHFILSALVLGSMAKDTTASGGFKPSNKTALSSAHNVSPDLLSFKPTKATISPAEQQKK